MMPGKNTLAAAELQSLVDRVENIDAQKKALSEDRKAIMQEAKSRGFNTAGITYLIKVRKMKPHDRQEAESIRDLYMHALGMDSEPPLFRQIEAMARDSAGGEKLVEALKLIVPPHGDVIINFGGKRIRLWRDKDGQAQAEDYTPPELHPTAGAAPARAPKKDVPDCSVAEAFLLGETAAKENKPVINNPFPYGDERRPKWDEGWRAGSGNDGMGS